MPASPDDAKAIRERLYYSDAELLAECEVHTYRASGPGGQKRNKTSSAVRLHHGPSGLRAPAEESRSQHENKARALRRLREAIGIGFRVAPNEPIQWPPGAVSPEGSLRISDKNPQRVELLARILDVLADQKGGMKETAEIIGVSPSSLTRFLAATPKAWAEANRIRQKAGLKALRSS